MSKTPKAQWIELTTKTKGVLGLRYKNTQKLRGRMRQAILQRRFFQFLASVRPASIFGVILPWLVIPAVIGSDETGFMYWFILFTKIISLSVLSAANALLISADRHAFHAMIIRHQLRKMRSYQVHPSATNH
jgi:hypothetical protein